MKTFIARIFFFFLAAFLLSGCLTPDRQLDIKPTPVIPTTTAVISTIKPTLVIPTATVVIPTIKPTIPSTSTPNPNFISANSPDNKYTIGLKLSESPVKLTITDNTSSDETEILLTYRSYNKIMGVDPGFTWTTDNKILMFVLYQEPFPKGMPGDFSVFVAVDVEQAKILTMNYSSMLRGVWYEDKSGMATLEHGGLNDIYDFYFPGTNCYKEWFESECEISDISPNGSWNLSEQDYGAGVDLIGSSGDTWKFTYSINNNSDYSPSHIQRWTSDGKYVFFSPFYADGSSKVYGLFRMDLTNGNVVSLIGNGYISNYYFYLSVSPDAQKIIYVTTDGRLVIKDLQDDTKKTIQISLNTSQDVSSFIWSPDETKVIFAKVKRDAEYNVVSTDYFLLDMETGKLVTLLKNEPDYLNVKAITNSEVSLGEKSFSLVDGAIIEPAKP